MEWHKLQQKAVLLSTRKIQSYHLQEKYILGCLSVVSKIYWPLKLLIRFDQTSSFNVGAKAVGKPFSKVIASAPAAKAIPQDRKPSYVFTQTIPKNQAAIYRLSGDYNALHIGIRPFSWREASYVPLQNLLLESRPVSGDQSYMVYVLLVSLPVELSPPWVVMMPIRLNPLVVDLPVRSNLEVSMILMSFPYHFETKFCFRYFRNISLEGWRGTKWYNGASICHEKP